MGDERPLRALGRDVDALGAQASADGWVGAGDEVQEDEPEAITLDTRQNDVLDGKARRFLRRPVQWRQGVIGHPLHVGATLEQLALLMLAFSGATLFEPVARGGIGSVLRPDRRDE